MAQTGNHTPGPWRVDPRTDRIVADSMSVGKPVVLDVARTFPRRGKQETDANARLIAAAPELLAALRLLLEQSQLQGEHAFSARTAIALSHAAIAKAEGR